MGASTTGAAALLAAAASAGRFNRGPHAADNAITTSHAALCPFVHIVIGGAR